MVYPKDIKTKVKSIEIFKNRLKVACAGQNIGIITQDEFDKLQVILGRKGKPRISKHEFPYKQVLKLTL